MAARLVLDRLRARFDGRAAVDGVSIDIEPGELLCLLGPSGCGKTTLLRMIGGYLSPDEGRILVDGVDVTRHPPERRRMGMVFQSYALFPHLSARANVEFGLEARGVPPSERARRADALLSRVGLSPAERARRPKALSGGQQQRVALARALIIEPSVLLLDEPMANLDRRLREQLREELKELQRRTGVTSLLVTHDQEEALTLATRVAVMVGGRVEQLGTPREVYARPSTCFVARFLGDANLIRVTTKAGKRWLLDGGLALEGEGFFPGATVLLRPEHLRIGPEALKLGHTVRGVVRSAGFLGPDLSVEVELTPQVRLRVRTRAELLPGAAPGDTVDLAVDAKDAWVIPEPLPPPSPGAPTDAAR